MLGKLNLENFSVGMQAVAGRCGCDHSDPRVVIALWRYALSRGVREARAPDASAQYAARRPAQRRAAEKVVRRAGGS